MGGWGLLQNTVGHSILPFLEEVVGQGKGIGVLLLTMGVRGAVVL